MAEPIKTQTNPSGDGAPQITEEQYMIWLDDMRPFLRAGHTLWYAMEKTNLLQHKDSIYKKYRENGWFLEKIDALRATVGEMVNAVGFKVIESINTKMVESNGKAELTSEEVQVWKTMAEKHRSAQPFFVSRTETAEAKDEQIGRILDRMESDYEQFAEDAGRATSKQVVANDTPVQNQGQGGKPSGVPAKPDSDPAHNGESGSQEKPNS